MENENRKGKLKRKQHHSMGGRSETQSKCEYTQALPVMNIETSKGGGPVLLFQNPNIFFEGDSPFQSGSSPLKSHPKQKTLILRPKMSDQTILPSMSVKIQKNPKQSQTSTAFHSKKRKHSLFPK